MLLPAIHLRKGDVITLPTRDGEYVVEEVIALDESETAILELNKIEAPTYADEKLIEKGALVNVVRRARQDHVEVTWTLLDPMTDQLIADRRTDRVNLTSARAHGHDDVTGIQRILAVQQLGTVTYAPSVVVLSVREV